MNRKIKFRGKRLDNGEWVYGSLDLTDNRSTISWDTVDRDGDDTVWFADVDPDTVGQFTGLTDKNGKEIYEGDIVLYGGKIKSVVEVRAFGYQLNGGVFGISNGHPALTFNSLGRSGEQEIIGSIHDTPELLNEKEK